MKLLLLLIVLSITSCSMSEVLESPQADERTEEYVPRAKKPQKPPKQRQITFGVAVEQWEEETINN